MVKAYQIEWFKVLKNRTDKTELATVLDEIIADDTGATDPLTQELAKILKQVSDIYV